MSMKRGIAVSIAVNAATLGRCYSIYCTVRWVCIFNPQLYFLFQVTRDYLLTAYDVQVTDRWTYLGNGESCKHHYHVPVLVMLANSQNLQLQLQILLPLKF
jgi:hypothetical protein